MQTTDKDIQALEEMRGECDYAIDQWKDALASPEKARWTKVFTDQRTALSHILADFRDMREMLEAAVSISVADGNAIWMFNRDMKSGKWYSTHPKTYTLDSDSALDAWRDGVKEGK